MSGMYVTANAETCVVSSLCVYQAPEVFDQDEQHGRVVVITPEPGSELHDDVRRASRGCPTQSISVIERH